MKKPVVGLLALQGAFAAHGEMLRALGAETVEVRRPEQMESVDGIAIPGGESTTLLRLMKEYAFDQAIHRFALSGRPLFATCMGLILLAREVTGPEQESLGLLDVSVRRNAYGRQVDSFEATGEVRGRPFPMIFIRAPRILGVGKNVEVVGSLNGDPVLVREKNIVAATFHPELSGDPAVHEIFLSMITEEERAAS